MITTTRLLESALAYAALGWLVIPLTWPESVGDALLCSCGNHDHGTNECGSPAKHPLTAHGLVDASKDATTIRNWWRQWPQANVGLVAGEKSGFVVLDVDPKHGGAESLERLMLEFGDLPETPEAKTGSGGQHILFAHPGRRVKNSVGRTGWLNEPGLDIRGDGGYIVAAPSQHICGNSYAWVASPRQIGLSAMPAWMLERMDQRKPAVSTTTTEWTSDERCRYWLGKALAKVGIGSRNETGLWLAVQLRDNRISQCDAESVMRDYAARAPRGDKPYRESEAMASLRSAYSSPPRDPAKGAAPQQKPDIPKLVQPPADAAEELEEYYTRATMGSVYEVPLPWPLTTQQTQALLPGSITMITGDPGVGKTFLVLQCLRFWHHNHFEPAVFFIEKNRRFHMMRLLAQLEDNGNFVNVKWIETHETDWRAAIERHRCLLKAIGKCIDSEPLQRVTLQTLLGWIRQKASAGKRVLVVDPITAVSAGNERWSKDEDFVLEAQQIIEAHGCSLVLMSHPKQGNRGRSMHDQAGGAAYSRFTDTDIWVYRTKTPKRADIFDIHGLPRKDTFHNFFALLKTRNGKGVGREIAFNFGEGLAYAEQGLVHREVKKEEAESTKPEGQP